MIWLAYFYCFSIGIILLYRGYLMYKGKKTFYEYKNRHVVNKLKLSKYHGLLLALSSLIYIFLTIATMLLYDKKQELIISGFFILCAIYCIIYRVILNKFSVKK